MTEGSPDYGVDAPTILRRLRLVGGLALLVALALYASGLGWPGHLAPAVALWSFGGATVMYTGSRFGKFRLRDRLLDRVPWRGDEHVLDVGCGHGLLLIGAAKRLPNGKAIGIDIWSHVDQADNRPEAPVDNARTEGVVDRIAVQEGAARTLEFGDESFDVVVSSFAVPEDLPRLRHGRREAVVAELRFLAPSLILSGVKPARTRYTSQS